jgi:hypothetical protein
VRWLVDRKRKDMSAAEAEFSPGVLMASGLIAGGAIAGVIQSVITFYEKDSMFDLGSRIASLDPIGRLDFGAWMHNQSWWPLVPFLVMAAGLYWVGVKREQPAKI